MQTGPEDRVELASRYYRAYEDDDREAMDAVLSPTFTFTSPLDDRIDLGAFLGRCWPNHEFIEKFDLLDVCADETHAVVRYRASTTDGGGFSNMEHLEFAGDRIDHIDVFFAETA